MAPNPNYHSYLLRIWRDGVDHPWRASLQSTAGEKLAFADIRTLFAFLIEQLTADQDRGEREEPRSPRSANNSFPTQLEE